MWKYKYTLGKLLSHYFEDQAICGHAGGERETWLADNGKQQRCYRCTAIVDGREKLAKLREAWDA